MNTLRPARHSSRRTALPVAIVFLLLVTLACSLTGTKTPTAAPPPPANAPATQAAQDTSKNLEGTRMALDLKSTMIAQQEQQLAMASTAAAQQPTQAPATAVPPPTQPPAPTEAPTQPPPPTAVPPTEAPTATPAPDIDSMIKNANILLYEDIAGYYNLTRWVRDALNDDDYEYQDVGDAVGNFKAEILSGKKWDLVIAAAEARKGFQGELFDYVADAANDDSAVILETWYLDYMAAGPISRITSECGVGFQKNWMNPDRDSRSIVWLDADHQLFHYPNEGFSLVHYSPYWEGDAGDMMYQKKSTGNGKLVAGLYKNEKGRYGTIAVCYDGRVIITTMSTHDYLKADMIDLWQNMIYYTLKHHFEKKLGLPPSP